MVLDATTQLRLGNALASSILPSNGLFSLWLQSLVRNRANLIVIPRYNLWFEPGEFNAAEEILPDVQDDDEGELGSDMSTDSTMTEALSRYSNKIPDFVVLHIAARPLPPNHPRSAILESIWITGETCALIMENTPEPEVRTANPTPEEIRKGMVPAIAQLQDSCHHAFGKYSGMQRTMAIATSGPYWTYAFVHRGQTANTDTWNDEIQWAGPATGEYFCLKFDPPDAANDEATRVVHDYLMRFAPLPEDLPGTPPAKMSYM